MGIKVVERKPKSKSKIVEKKVGSLIAKGLKTSTAKKAKTTARKVKSKKAVDPSAKQFMSKKPAAAMGVDKVVPKDNLAKLQRDFEGLAVGYKRGELLKGKKSKYYPVFLKLGMIERYGGGKVSYRAKGGKSMPISTTGKHGGKKQMVRGSDDHLFLPPFSKTKEEKKLSAKKKKTVKAKGGGKVVYRKVSGKVLDGNDIIKMIYDKQI